MINQVAIITNFRTGSTSFTLLKSEQYKLPYKAELFAHNRPEPLGRAKSAYQINENYKHWSPEEKAAATSEEFFIQQLEAGHACCFKVMPNQIKSDDSMARILNQVDKVYYLYRRDFLAQLKSWITVRQKGDFGGTGFINGKNTRGVEKMKELHLAKHGVGETVKHHIDIAEDIKRNPSLRTHNLCKGLIENYERMAEIMKKHPGELICMEDYFKELSYPAYNREITWETEPEIPEDFNVEKLLKSS